MSRRATSNLPEPRRGGGQAYESPPACPPPSRRGGRGRAATRGSWRPGLAIGDLWRVLILAVVAPRRAVGPRARGQAVLGVVCFLGVAAGLSRPTSRASTGGPSPTGIGLQLVLAVLILRVAVVYHGVRGVGAAVPSFWTSPTRGRSSCSARWSTTPSEKAFGKDERLRVRVHGPADGHLRLLVLHRPVPPRRPPAGGQGVRPGSCCWCSMGTSGAETLSATANVFMGQTEAPLIVKPYVAEMTRSELLALMIGGMATISGGMMAVYIEMGADPVAILARASWPPRAGCTWPSCCCPETGEPATRGDVKPVRREEHANVIDAAAGRGVRGDEARHQHRRHADRVHRLHRPVQLPARLARARRSGVPQPVGLRLSVFSKVFAPVAFLMGVPAGRRAAGRRAARHQAGAQRVRGVHDLTEFQPGTEPG